MNFENKIVGVIFSAFTLLMSLPATAEDIEWKYFTSPGYVKNLEAGETGYKVCADPSWGVTAPEKDKVALVPTRKCDFPSIPSEGVIYGCLAGGDVVAVNWTSAKAEGKTKALLKVMSSIGFETVVIPESTATAPDYSSRCVRARLKSS